jgi:hypothetical protein
VTRLVPPIEAYRRFWSPRCVTPCTLMATNWLFRRSDHCPGRRIAEIERPIRLHVAPCRPMMAPH